MASIEFIQKRIDGYKKTIEKLEKKLERIEKAEASNWENNPYYYIPSDKKYTLRDLENARQSLAEFEDKLAEATEKANSRDVKAILDFLADWKDRMYDYFIESLPRYLEERAEWFAEDHEYCDMWNSGYLRNCTAEERKEIETKYKAARKEFYSRWNWYTPYLENDSVNTEKLSKDLNNEADAKYDDIIERTNKIVGTIIDASSLSVGLKGDLNGFIVGDKGTAEVRTIGAGGYNIQCYHFRTLIKRV